MAGYASRLLCPPTEALRVSALCFLLFFFFLNIFLRFIYFERERERERERESESMSRGGAERKGERILGRLCPVSTEPDVGLDLINCEVMT